MKLFVKLRQKDILQIVNFSYILVMIVLQLFDKIYFKATS